MKWLGKQPHIVVFEKRLGEVEIDRAFAIGQDTMWFKAVMQLLEDYQRDCVTSAVSAVSENNAMIVTLKLGGAASLQEVIDKFEELRASAVDKAKP